MHKAWAFVVIGLLLLPSLYAQNQSEFTFSDALSFLQGITKAIGIDESPLFTLIRFAIIFLIAFLLTKGINLLGANNGIALGIAIPLALISGVLIPSSALAFIGGTYAAIFSLLLLLAPIAGLMFLVYGIIPSNPPFWRLVRILLLVLAIIGEVWFVSWLTSL